MIYRYILFMPITKKEVEHVASLARLGLSEKEKDKLSRELNGILDYFEKLKEIDTKNIEPTAQVTGLTNVFRKDENHHEIDAEKIKDILGQVPEREGNFIKTKPVFEK